MKKFLSFFTVREECGRIQIASLLRGCCGVGWRARVRACTLFVYQFFSTSSIADPSAFALLRAMSFRISSLMYPCLLPTSERWSSMSASVDFCSLSFTCTVLSLSHSAAAFVLPISHHLACVCPPYVHYDITVYTACQPFFKTFFKIFFSSLYAIVNCSLFVRVE